MTEIPNPAKKRYWESSDFWKDAGERVVTAFIEGALSGITIDQLTNASLSWRQVLLVGGVGAVVSTVKALIGAQKGNSTTPVSIT